ncbi:MAG: extracellular solute-binding protein [Chloroflexota bacterium]
MFIPYADSVGDRNGVVIGGAVLWLMDAEEAAKDAAACEFMKFMAAESQQVTWHTGTGYFPVRTDISSNSDLTTFWLVGLQAPRRFYYCLSIITVWLRSFFSA